MIRSLIACMLLFASVEAVPVKDYFYLKSVLDLDLVAVGEPEVIDQEGVVPATFVKREGSARLALVMPAGPDRHAALEGHEEAIASVIGKEPNQWSFTDVESVGFIVTIDGEEHLAEVIELLRQIVDAPSFDLHKMQFIIWGPERFEGIEELIRAYFSFEERVSQPLVAVEGAEVGEEFSRAHVLKECFGLIWDLGLKEVKAHYELWKLQLSPWSPTAKSLKIDEEPEEAKGPLVILAPGMGGRLLPMLRIAEKIRALNPQAHIVSLPLSQETEEGGIPVKPFSELIDQKGKGRGAIVIGHSLGGIAGAAAACKDQRIKHVYSLDSRLKRCPEENRYPWFSSDVCGQMGKIDVEKLNTQNRLTTFTAMRSGLVPSESSAVGTGNRRVMIKGTGHLGICFDKQVIDHIGKAIMCGEGVDF